jgi:hypothetical protein
MNDALKLLIVCIGVSISTGALAEAVDLESFSTNTGECSVAVKEDLQKASVEKTFSAFTSYTIAETPIDRRRGASPPTGSFIAPLQTVMCLAKDGDKMLVTTLDPLNKSCGWVDTNNLKVVEETGTIIGDSMEPCGEIEPIEVGEFCAKIAKNKDLALEAQKLTRFCNIEGVKTATIDAKFVTNNTTSRLYSDAGSEKLVERKIPVYLTGDSEEKFKDIEVFSLSEIFDVFQKSDGQLRVLLGVGEELQGWADLSSGHIWYSNLTTYFKPDGSEDVYLSEIFSSQSDNPVIAKKPSKASFVVNEEYVKFPVLFDMREKGLKATASFTPQLQIAFIGKFCEEGAGASMCTETDNFYSNSLSNLRAADVVFLIDGSKSMKEYFGLVAESLTNFTKDYIGNPDYRFGVAMYGDFLSPATTSIGDPVDFKVIRDLKADYSGDFKTIANAELLTQDALKDKSEAVHTSVYEAARSFQWAEGKPHFLIHIADHGDRQRPNDKVYRELAKNNIFYIPIAVEGEAILKESEVFVAHSKDYFRSYRTLNGNPMAVEAIVSYGQGNNSARDNIAAALVEATNTVSAYEGKGTILPTLGPAVRDIFNIPNVDEIDTIAAVGNVKTAKIEEVENNWNYFVALNKIELQDIRRLSEEVCYSLGSGSDAKTAEKAILKIVQILTGDKKSPEDLAQQLREGSIPLQTSTIIGKGLIDFILRAKTGNRLDEYKKEFCRTELLTTGIQKNVKIMDPEDGKDLLWNNEFYETRAEVAFDWTYKDVHGREVIYLPLDYLPRPLN